ncbi:unnamed protein product [Lactuca saligna]|uniref:Transmembrane protein n=1 Tax=Lactuca saligna TaxID=75948 RepID=A0AA36EIN8_LACSI|nr:unnamed protein product [Lactuca saligna]
MKLISSFLGLTELAGDGDKWRERFTGGGDDGGGRRFVSALSLSSYLSDHGGASSHPPIRRPPIINTILELSSLVGIRVFASSTVCVILNGSLRDPSEDGKCVLILTSFSFAMLLLFVWILKLLKHISRAHVVSRRLLLAERKKMIPFGMLIKDICRKGLCWLNEIEKGFMSGFKNPWKRKLILFQSGFKSRFNSSSSNI